MIKEEEYEIVGYIKKMCVCDKCFCEMESARYELASDPPKRIMRCPKCGKEEAIHPDALADQFRLIKKKEEE